MPANNSRRQWLKQTSLASLGLGFSFRSMANEEGLTRSFGIDSGLINLGSNENPYGISPKAREAILGMLGESHRYLFNVAPLRGFKKELATHLGVEENQVLVTAGSGDGLGFLARHFSAGNIVAANPTFGILPSTAKSIGAPVKEILLTTEKVHDLPAMAAAVDSKTSLIYICNPANPTATMLQSSVLKDFCREQSKKTSLLIDEAYIDFPQAESMRSMTVDNPNILVLGTFSKIHAMAGLRIGYTIAHPSVIRKLEENYYQRSQFSCSVLSIAAARASLKDDEHIKRSRQKNEEPRAYTFNELKKMNFTCYPSFTNFLFFKLNNYSGSFADDMLKKNILLRSNNYNDGQWCRVSIGTLQEMQSFISTLKSVAG
jgi:histidinol-phosphate aminotransferase